MLVRMTVDLNMSSDRAMGIRRHPLGEPDIWKWSGYVECLGDACRTFHQSKTPDAAGWRRMLKLVAAFLRYRNRCSNFHVLHKTFHSAVVSSNFCAASKSKDHDFLCDLVCYLVQFLLLRCVSAYGASSMRRKERENQLH